MFRRVIFVIIIQRISTWKIFNVENIIFLLLYRDGTTDVTRTLHFGTPTDFQKVMFITLKVVSQNDWVLTFVPFLFHTSNSILWPETTSNHTWIYLQEDYTIVLMGAIDLATTIWANGTYGKKHQARFFYLKIFT